MLDFERCKEYHELLWSAIVNKLESDYQVILNRGIVSLKVKCIKELYEAGKIEGEFRYPFNGCYLCEYYETCEDCPLMECNEESEFSCGIYSEFLRSIVKNNREHTIELAKQIRDVFK